MYNHLSIYRRIISFGQTLSELAFPLAELDALLGMGEKKEQQLNDELCQGEKTKAVLASQIETLEKEVSTALESVARVEENINQELKPRNVRLKKSLGNLINVEKKQLDERVEIVVQEVRSLSKSS